MSIRVKILEAVNYEPTASDSRACFGQLAKRARIVNGVAGPMVHYFPKGRQPELRDDVAADFINRGVAEAITVDSIIDVSREEILKDVVQI